MKRAAFSLLSLAVGMVPVGLAHTTTRSGTLATGPVVAAASSIDSGESRHTTVVGGAISEVLAVVSPAIDTRDDERELARQRLRDGQAGTYINDILIERDSSVARWPSRKAPLTVWIQPASPVVDFEPALVASVQQAFQEWDALDLPVHFRFVADSAKAEVHVNWIDRFTQPISGRTRWSRDDDWLITDANIILAVHHSQGDVLGDESMRAMALHEVGHLLGLDHTRDATSIMAPMVRARQLTDADRATVRLVYALPAGPLR
jgi:predicted Zn-dependent protease